MGVSLQKQRTRSTSPNLLNEYTVKIINIPGKIAIYGAFCRYCCELCSKLPQLDIGAATPSPRKLSELSVMMAFAISAVAAVIIVGNTAGKTCFTITIIG